jgi:hypothetical protein
MAMVEVVERGQRPGLLLLHGQIGVALGFDPVSREGMLRRTGRPLGVHRDGRFARREAN